MDDNKRGAPIPQPPPPPEPDPPPFSLLDILSNFAESVGKEPSGTEGTNSQQISPSKDKTAELNDVLVAVGEKFNLTCRYKGFERSSVMEIQWQKDSFPLISASPGMNNTPDSINKHQFDVDNMFIQFNGECDSKEQPCIADLHVQNAEPSDSGLYQCVGSSDIGATRSAFYNVKVINHYRPNDVRMRLILPQQPTSVDQSDTSRMSSAVGMPTGGQEGTAFPNIYQGQPVTFQCSSNGFPSPSLNFYLEGTLIPVFAKNFNNIEVLDVSISQTGSSREQNMTVNSILFWKSVLQWHCTAKNVEGESKSPVVFTRYHFAPHIISSRTEWRELKHTNVVVPCYYREGFPSETEVKWVYGSYPLSGHIVSRNQNLTFSKEEFDSGKAGEYTCIVENAVGQAHHTIRLLVDYAPIVTLDQSSVKIAEGERLALVCRVSAQPEATIQWTLKGQSANMEFQSFKDKPSLVISSVEQYHSGRISCIATNKYGSTEASAQVTVQYPPSINLKLEPSRSSNDYREGERVTLKCTVDSVPPPKTISIKRADGAPFSQNVIEYNPLPTNRYNNASSGEISGESRKVVEISSLTRSHSGQYKCLANNGLGITNDHTISLRVQYGPQIAAMKPVHKNEGESLTLHCMVLSEPDASIIWSHPTKGVLSNKAAFKILSLSRSDSGRYICKATVKYYDGEPNSATQTVDVFVSYEPEIVPCPGEGSMESDVYANLGSPVDLCCAVSSHPASTISWSKQENGSLRPLLPEVVPQVASNLSSSSAFSTQTKSVIHLQQLTQSDLGTYICQISVGKSDKSRTKTRTIYVKELKIPDAPVLNTASPDLTGGIRLMWETDRLAKYYKIGYRLTGSTDQYKVLPSKENRDTSVVPDLQAGKPYQFVVQGCNDAGCSPFSNSLSSKPIPVPDGSRIGGSGEGDANGASIPVSTVVVVPLALVGVILLLSLLIVICRKRHSNRRAQKEAYMQFLLARSASDQADIRAVAISTDAYTIAPKYGGAPPYTPSVGSGGTLRGHVHNNGSVPRGSLPGGTPTPANGGPPPSTLISSYSAGHSILANPGAISGVTTTAVPGPYASLKSAGGISPGSAPPPPAPPGVAGIMGSRNGSPLGTTGVSVVPHTNGHVLKGLGPPDEKFNAPQSYITITQPNGSLIRSTIKGSTGSNEVGKFSPTPSQQTSPSLPSEEHLDSNGGPKTIYLQNMSMDRVAFSKLKGGDGSLSDSSTKERDRVRFTDANGITHYPGGEEEPDLPRQQQQPGHFDSLKTQQPNKHLTNNAKYSTLPTISNHAPSNQGGILQNYRSAMGGPQNLQQAPSATVVLANGNLPQQPAQIAISPDIYLQQQPGTASIVMNNKPISNNPTPNVSSNAPPPPLRKTQRLSPIETNGVPLGTVIKQNPQGTTNLIPPNTKFVVYPPSQQNDKHSSSLTSSNSPQMGECVSPFTESMSGSFSSDNTTSNRSQTGFSVTSV
ncbi:uncharacterized protein LOC142345818 isoform X3 [Convolutriloba macropyga]|uniref:uncharacterized protein LOC142345818 isoform X3 n=1 Tax=Convolutriloba macropyga TaxID=536237 RepID=UPI003F51C47C